MKAMLGKSRLPGWNCDPGHVDLHSLLEPLGIHGFPSEGQQSTCLAQLANGPKGAAKCTHSCRNSEES